MALNKPSLNKPHKVSANHWKKTSKKKRCLYRLYLQHFHSMPIPDAFSVGPGLKISVPSFLMTPWSGSIRWLWPYPSKIKTASFKFTVPTCNCKTLAGTFSPCSIWAKLKSSSDWQQFPHHHLQQTHVLLQNRAMGRDCSGLSRFQAGWRQFQSLCTSKVLHMSSTSSSFRAFTEGTTSG